MKPPDAALALVRDARSVVIATHSPMDGDGLGCGLALLRVLRAAGKDATFVTEAPVPRAYSFLAETAGIVRLAGGPPPAGDLLLGLDAGEADRLGRVYSERAAGMSVLNVDHHVSNPGYGDVAWVEPAAAATGEQVFQLIRALGWEIDAKTAQALLISLVTDTGRFCYSSTTANTLATAAELVRLGAEPDEVQRNLYGAVPLAVHRLRARAVDSLAFAAGGRVASLTVPHDFGHDLGVDAEDVKDLIDIVISVDGVMVAVLVRGLAGGGTKVSLRSKSDLANVAAFALREGGGGHVRAAGFSSLDEPGAVSARILPGLEALAVAAGE